MGNQFEWQVDDAEDRAAPPLTSRYRITSRRWLLLAAVASILVVAGWYLLSIQLRRADQQLLTDVQNILDLEQQAVLGRDGELFISLQDVNPALLSAQLMPANQAVIRAGQVVVSAEQQGDEVHAEVAWPADGREWRRVAFFKWQAGQLYRSGGSADYWGEQRRLSRSWGELTYHHVDEDWAEAIADFVDETVIRLCAGGCLPDQLPFELMIASGYEATAAPGRIQLPSPRLMALTEDEQPAPQFWERLSRQLEAHLTQAEIRFAVPGPSASRYLSLAERFNTAQRHIRVVIVPYDVAGPTAADAAIILAEADGAYLRPTETLLAAGMVRDLTDFVDSDPVFDQVDFYEQVWRGAWWQERIWMMPLGAGLKLLFYDPSVYSPAIPADNGLNWSWPDLTDVLSDLSTAPDSANRPWVFLDNGPDTLLAYAFNWQNECRIPFGPGCNQALGTSQLAAALGWYQEQVAQGHMPNVGALSPEERAYLPLRLVGSQRQVVFWVEDPVNYEHHMLLSRVGVISFPGAPGYTTVTPLWVQGGVISQGSERPRAVWEWLKFLSYERIDRQQRLVPARPSVARETDYWETLPGDLRATMPGLFSFARPVSFTEERYFSWELLAAVADGRLSPEEAATARPRLHWFGIGGAEAGR